MSSKEQTMKKLLHERLREFSQKCSKDWSIWYDLCSAIEIDCIGYNEFASKIADEIERYYIPRPRFEDGEPVQFGDKFEKKNGNEGTVTSIHFTDGHYYINKKHATGRPQLSEPLKRIATKVLDADGVEIKIGDYVYYAVKPFDGIEGTVRRIEENGITVVVDCKQYMQRINSENLTHKKPVLDADGVEIEVGSMVYDLIGLYQTPLEVLEIRENSITVSIPDGKGYTSFTPDNLTHKEPVLDADDIPIKVGENRYSIKTGEYLAVNKVGTEYCLCTVLGDGCTLGTCGYKPSELSSKEPDSLEKLRDDIANYLPMTAISRETAYEWADRLSALIEMGA